MTQPHLFPSRPVPSLTAIGFGLLSVMATGSTLLAILCSQIVAQRPAGQGVLVFHLGKAGELRLWNQPIRPQDVPALLERARLRSKTAQRLVVRLVPDPLVPWGVVNGMLSRLRPPALRDGWILQLQLP